MDPGGYRKINFIASKNNPNVTENWIPVSQRKYLNQLSLGSNGWKMCSVSSMAMVMAMNGQVSPSAMASKAQEMFTNRQDTGRGVLGWVYPPNGSRFEAAYVWMVGAELVSQVMSAQYVYRTADDTWNTIKSEVNSGRPVILDSPGEIWSNGVKIFNGEMTSAGHFIVAVGYQEAGGNRTLIAYDPYGKWKGTCCINNYDVNQSSSSSHKGEWVFYDYSGKMNRSRWVITTRSITSASNLMNTFTELTPPDLISDEPENIVTFQGFPINESQSIYLPLIIK